MLCEVSLGCDARGKGQTALLTLPEADNHAIENEVTSDRRHHSTFQAKTLRFGDERKRRTQYTENNGNSESLTINTFLSRFA